MLTVAQFDRMRHLAMRLAGIELHQRHHELLAHRVQRKKIRGSERLDALLDAVEAGEAGATRQLVGLLTTNVTGFFRHPRHFAVAADHALRAVRPEGLVRLWSAAAASGEEPYSLAMAVMEATGGEEPPVSILATDIDADALAVAEAGVYPERAVHALPPAQRDRFFLKTTSGGWSVAPAVRRLVEFRPLNLAGEQWPAIGPFAVVFCRNALMYLESQRRVMALERIATLLSPDGVLILDPTEHLGRAAHLFSVGSGGVHTCLSSAGTAAAPQHFGIQNQAPLGNLL